MNGRTLILLIVAVAVAVVTVVVIRNHTQGNEPSGVKVLVAVNDIPAGSFIRSDKDLAWVDYPQNNISPAYITPDAHQIEEFNGAVARADFAANEPLKLSSIIRTTEGGFMSAVLKPGMRAVSIAVSLTSGNAGFVFPGDKVDLLLTHRIALKDSNENVLASETFIKDVRVLAIDQMLENPDNKATVAKTITLEVTPKQAEEINVATSLGSISVSLRSLSSKAVAKTTDPITPTGSAASDAAATVSPAASVPVPSAQGSGESYTTDNDVSQLLNNRSNVRTKVSVYHGSNTAEQLDFHGGSK